MEDEGPMGSQTTASGEETEALGRRFAKQLRRGDIVLIRGGLGAGKTTFVRGVCRGLGVEVPVTSPTYTIGQVYEGRDRKGEPLLISHLDLYRLGSLEDEDPALLDDYLVEEGVALLEWPEVAEAPLAGRTTYRVSIEDIGEGCRLLSFG